MQSREAMSPQDSKTAAAAGPSEEQGANNNHSQTPGSAEASAPRLPPPSLPPPDPDFLNHVKGLFAKIAKVFNVPVSEVLPDLYLGNYRDSQDHELLVRHNITHILSIHDKAAPMMEDMAYLCISAGDHTKQNLVQHFKDCISFIHECRLKGEGCLVHCVAGVSRSVTVVVAYIMIVTGRGWVESLAAVRAARQSAGPNLGFLRQLEEFEKNGLTEYRAWWMDKYKKNPFNDVEEVVNLLARKNQAMANGIPVTNQS